MKNYFLAAIIAVVALTLSAPVSWAWQKDSGSSCERVFASIQNEEGNRNWDGTVTANGNVVVTQSGSAASNQWVTVEWIPTSGFSGTVEATVRLLNVNGGTADSETVEGNLDCPEASPMPTQEVTPTPTTAPSTNSGGPGDGKSDNLGCSVHDCSNHPSSQPQVLGASTGPQVLGLSTTSGDTNSLLAFAQLSLAFILSLAGFSLFRKNAR